MLSNKKPGQKLRLADFASVPQHRLLLLPILFATLALPGVCHAENDGHLNPLRAPNLSPTALIFGLPDLQTRLLSPKHPFELSLRTHVANTFVNRERENESIFIDGEVMSTTLELRGKLAENWEASISIPYIEHSKGTMDDLIFDWHDWFGLPQGGRQQATNDQFSYLYSNEGVLLLDVHESRTETGDLRLGIYHRQQWLEQEWIIQSEIKAPTGDADALTGSGAWDMSFGVGWQRELESKLGSFSHFAGLGFSYLGESDLELQKLQKRWALSGRAGFHWHALNWLSFTVQLDSNTPLYDSDLKNPGGMPMQLSVGTRFFISENLRFDASFGEDLNTLASPDFVVGLDVSLLW